MASRKRKRRDQTPGKASDKAPGWAWMLFGLSIGLAVALVVYLRSAPEPPAGVFAPPEASLAAPPAAAGTAGPAQAPPPSAAAATPVPADAAAGTGATPAEAELEFYELLGEIEVSVPESGLPTDTRPTEYTIQAGSFRSIAEADRLKARLALLGIESGIVNAIVGNDVWYRVIIGPLRERGEINTVLRKLRDERITPLPPQPVSD